MPSPLDLDLATMRQLGHKVTDLVATHLATLRDQPAFATVPAAEVMQALAKPAPEEGTSFDALIETLQERVIPNAAREPHPGFIAYVPSCPTFPAVLGDWIATGFNFFAGVWAVAVGPNALELVVLDWFREWLGMPAGTRGLLTSGGSNATLTAIIAARHEVVGEDTSRLPRLTMYTSDQAHSSVARAAWMAGIARSQVRSIMTDAAFRMDPRALEASIAADRAQGLIPCAVVASAATTNTGAVDPLDDIADLCEREKIWLHIDAAYGGFAALTEEGKRALAGIERADSVTLDPHKWLFVPFECGCLLVKDPSRLSAAFAIHPEYLQDVTAISEVNFSDYGEQLTRYSRAIKVWLSVNYFGLSAIREAIARGIALTAYAERLARARPQLEVMSPAQFGVFCFRVHPEGLDDAAALDALNERVNAEVVSEGRYFISSTRLRGAYSLRICILGFRTEEKDVEGLMESVVRVAGSD
jgi:glutamate/tyrosine decarboxylase-like PLP-dependent enzyme